MVFIKASCSHGKRPLAIFGPFLALAIGKRSSSLTSKIFFLVWFLILFSCCCCCSAFGLPSADAKPLSAEFRFDRCRSDGDFVFDPFWAIKSVGVGRTFDDNGELFFNSLKGSSAINGLIGDESINGRFVKSSNESCASIWPREFFCTGSTAATMLFRLARELDRIKSSFNGLKKIMTKFDNSFAQNS